jgi:hypothetical protein
MVLRALPAQDCLAGSAIRRGIDDPPDLPPGTVITVKR